MNVNKVDTIDLNMMNAMMVKKGHSETINGSKIVNATIHAKHIMVKSKMAVYFGLHYN